MRAANSWINKHNVPPPVLRLPLPLATSKSAVPLSDCQSSQDNDNIPGNPVVSSSTSKRPSLASRLVPDKENKTQGLDVLTFRPDVLSIGHNTNDNSSSSSDGDSKNLLESLPALPCHDCNDDSMRSISHSQSSTGSTRSSNHKRGIWTDIWVDNDNDNDDLFLGCTAATVPSNKQLTTPITSAHTTTSSQRSSSSSSGGSAVVQNETTFWMKFLEQPSETNSMSSPSPSHAVSITTTHDHTDDCLNCSPTMGRIIQQNLTLGSLMSEASAYDTGTAFSKDETETKVDARPAPAAVLSSSHDGILLSPVQAARRRFEQQSQKAILQQAVLVRGSSNNAYKNRSERRKKDQNTTTGSTFNQRILEAAKSSSVSSISMADSNKTAVTNTTTSSMLTASCTSPVAHNNTSSATSTPVNINQPLHHDRFQEAYNAWQRAGLMKGPGQKRNKMSTPSAFYSQGKTTAAATPPKALRPGAAELLETEHSNTDREFKNLLSAWRSVANDNANSRFLSPESCSGRRRQTFQPSTTSKLPGREKDNAENLSESAVSQKTKAIEKDSFGTISEQLLADEERNNHKHAQTFTHETNLSSSARVVDSDNISEDLSFVERDESTRALAISTSKDLPSLASVTCNQQNLQLNDCTQCECSGSIFSGNDELISFFLPQMGLACTCGKKKPEYFANPDDPTALENVLRPWQVEFLKSFGIFHGEQLVKARHRSAGALAAALRQWRRKEGMVPFKLSSCNMAIDIWAKTCKIFVRSMRRQQIQRRHDLLPVVGRQSDEVMMELTHLVGGLPAAPKRRSDLGSCFPIDPESEMEV